MNVTSNTQNGLWTISGSYNDNLLFARTFVVDTTVVAPSITPFIIDISPNQAQDNSGNLTAIIVLAILVIIIAFIVLVIRKRNQRKTLISNVEVQNTKKDNQVGS
jgi:hypothetical protein